MASAALKPDPELYPGDGATPADIRQLADQYRSAALAVRALGKKGQPLTLAPYRALAIHAIELYLSAWLRERGCSGKALRGLHHDLATLTALAQSKGLSLRSKTMAHLQALFDRREYLVSRYAPEGASSCSPLTRMEATLNEVAERTVAPVTKRPGGPLGGGTPGTVHSLNGQTRQGFATMTNDTNTPTVDTAHIAETPEEPRMPGHESQMGDKPDWQPRYPGSGRLKGKVAIVTGADSGIGRAIAVLFAREGANVAIAYLEEHDDAEATKGFCEAEGAEVLLWPGDLGEPGHGAKLVEKVIDNWGKLDVLVNNAGEQHPDQDITDITPQQLQRTFQTNIFSQFYMVQAARPHLKPGAAIVNCTSVTMYKGSSELLDYSATKGAITAFTRSLSENLIEHGIRVNAVAPGPIWTPLNPFGGSSAKKMEHFGENTPIGRPGQPNEVAPAFLFLACEDASYMSGQVLHPNGGIVVNG